VRGVLKISAHWHLSRYFFRFTYLKEGSRAATIGYANLQMSRAGVTTTSR
jgi:hypothetical protein